jgi:calcineurin-like phosphoesterase family protein
MRSAVVSDLHLGMSRGGDIAAAPEVRERLIEAVADADRVVLLGDLLELREGRLVAVLEAARPLIESLGRVTAGRRVTIVPGNHDHHLAEPWLTRLRVDRPLGPENEWPVEPNDGVAGRLAEWMPDTELTVAYPGIRLRDDVYATHGHYLDVHLTVPRIESILASAMVRVSGRRDRVRTPADYEAVLAPLYAFHFALAQGASRESLERGGRLSRKVWRRANSDGGGSRLAGVLLGRVTIPGAVAVLNAAGIGPFSARLTGDELRSAGLRAMATVVDNLGVDAEHVISGHTHRAGPLPGDDEHEWRTLRGARLWNTGTWFHEDAFLRAGEERNPYFPGTVVRLDDEGPPRIENALAGMRLPR